jgi:hypothetical protein
MFADCEFCVFEYQVFLFASVIQNDSVFEYLCDAFSKSEIPLYKILPTDSRDFLPFDSENGLKSERLRSFLWDVVFGMNSPRQFERIDPHKRFFRSKHSVSRQLKVDRLS